MGTRSSKTARRPAAGARPAREIAAGQFKARCLALMDRVRDRREEYVITKHGKPVARLVPIDMDEEPKDAWGWMKGTVLSYGDLISPIDVEWDALSDEPDDSSE